MLSGALHLESAMKGKTCLIAIASMIATLPSAAIIPFGRALAGPIVPKGHYCLSYNVGGSDCSFTSYTQCLATASGIDAECDGKTVRDDQADLSPAARPAPIQSFGF